MQLCVKKHFEILPFQPTRRWFFFFLNLSPSFTHLQHKVVRIQMFTSLIKKKKLHRNVMRLKSCCVFFGFFFPRVYNFLINASQWGWGWRWWCLHCKYMSPEVVLYAPVCMVQLERLFFLCLRVGFQPSPCLASGCVLSGGSISSTESNALGFCWPPVATWKAWQSRFCQG